MRAILPPLVRRSAGRLWSTIQMTTAGGAYSILDLVLSNPDIYTEFIVRGETDHQRVTGEQDDEQDIG
jgi:hypothetical protein